jgi:hypothetical protein
MNRESCRARRRHRSPGLALGSYRHPEDARGATAGGLAIVLASLLLTALSSRAGAAPPSSVTVEKVTYKGWQDCVRLSNGEIELIATTVVGPRLIRFSFVGGENQFRELPGQIGRTGGTEWRLYGGHRLWHSPEANPRTYEPDNAPIQSMVDGGVLRLIQPTEKTTGIQKEMAISMDPAGAHVQIRHRLTNRGLWPVTLAAWSLSAMERGGRAVLPQSRKSTPNNLLPNRAVILWPYTEMSDARVVWGKKYILVQQDTTISKPFKVGMTSTDGWAGYVRKGQLFLKRFTPIPDALYPDFGSSVEAYTNNDFLELETVGPLRELRTGQTAEHIEDWYLFRDVDAQDEAAVDRTVLPQVRATTPP